MVIEEAFQKQELEFVLDLLKQDTDGSEEFAHFSEVVIMLADGLKQAPRETVLVRVTLLYLALCVGSEMSPSKLLEQLGVMTEFVDAQPATEDLN
jgi:hypothetical protein